MKKIIFLIGISALLGSCQDEVVERYKVSSPVYMSYNDLRKAVTIAPDTKTELRKPGKIYYWNNYLLINENNKGIHVIDNSDPSKPKFKTFISIPGNVDMSVKDGILYADSYIDLVALDINDINNIKEVNRLDSVFPYTLPEMDNRLVLEQINQQKGVVVGYTEKYVEKDLYKPEGNYYPTYRGMVFEDAMYMNFAKSSTSGSTTSATNSGIGIGGSMARFAIDSVSLYAINQSSQILIFDITQVKNPIKKEVISRI